MLDQKKRKRAFFLDENARLRGWVMRNASRGGCVSLWYYDLAIGAVGAAHDTYSAARLVGIDGPA